jgi:hypothetical protein
MEYENADKCIFENISDKYRFGKQRDSSRLLALDKTFKLFGKSSSLNGNFG